MLLEEFVRAILPPTPNYYVEYKTASRHKQGPALKTINEVILALRKQIAEEREVWLATGSYGATRTQADCRKKKGFCLDLDCGVGPKKQYSTQEEAKAAIACAVSDGHVPEPSLILDSGNGLHVWWFLEKEIPATDWQVLADKLKTVCILQDIKADPSVTADAARIMRVPEAVNWKDRNNPKPVRVTQPFTRAYTAEFFTLLFSEIDPAIASSKSTVPALAGTLLNNPVGANVEDLTNGMTNQFWFSNLGPDEKARTLKRMLTFIPDNHSYKMWEEIGGALRTCISSTLPEEFLFELWQDWSKSASNYEGRDSLEKKWAKLGSDRLSVGTLIFYAQQGGFNHNNEVVAKVIYPDSYVAGKECTWRIERDAEGETTAHFVFAAHLREAMLVEDDEDEVFFATLYSIPAKKSFPLRIGRKELQGDQTARNILHRANIFDGNQLKEVRRFMAAFMDMLHHHHLTHRAVRSYGWTRDDPPGFALGRSVHRPDGTETRGVLIDTQLLPIYEPRGTLQRWQQVTQYILDQQRHEINCVIATAFAAPLVHFTGLTGSVVSIAGKETGTGKSTALKAAQGVWGCPIKGVNALDDTVNSVVKKLEFLNCLPAYWDELRMKEEVLRFIKLIFSLSQGKGKSRLHSSANMQASGTWETLITCATNEPLRDYIASTIGDSTDAGHVRLFEIRAPLLGQATGLNKEMERFRDLNENYGHAGLQYAKWLATHYDEARAATEKVMDIFTRALNPNNRERFWVMTISAIYAGALLANRIGLLKFDLQGLRNCLIDTFKLHNVAFGTEQGSSKAMRLLAQYLNENAASALVTDYVRFSGPGRPKAVDVLQQPEKLPMTHQSGTMDNRIMVHQLAFTRWLDKCRSVPQSSVMDELKGIIGVHTHVRTSFAKGANVLRLNNHQTDMIIIDQTAPEPSKYLSVG